MYLYKTTIYKNTNDVIGAEPNNDTNLSDFENNFKASALQVNSVNVSETSFEIVKGYADFKDLIDGVSLTWADVRYIENEKYELSILNLSPLE